MQVHLVLGLSSSVTHFQMPHVRGRWQGPGSQSLTLERASCCGLLTPTLQHSGFHCFLGLSSAWTQVAVLFGREQSDRFPTWVCDPPAPNCTALMLMRRLSWALCQNDSQVSFWVLNDEAFPKGQCDSESHPRAGMDQQGMGE